MQPLIVLVSVLILTLLATALLPSRIANAHVKSASRFLTWLIAVECVLAVMLAIGYTTSGRTPLSLSLFEPLGSPSLGFDIYFDGATSLMLVLVSFVGLVVSRFSMRYLDGEAMQGRYFRWLGFAVGAVSLMVIAGNLLLFFAAWVMTSFGLHQLLLHYRGREAAHRAAWTKFAISRLGDAFLVGALILTYNTFGTFNLPELFAAAADLANTGQVAVNHLAIGWLLVLGAVTKSAQFPFHTWLPDTMETPTPVSALMHAGIVNAGGYLIIRMSPLVALAPEALMALAAIGAFTACFAGVVMMTQPSVKRALAYSTIAQMGFMMLQCGLGAFSAAMLHILAHSLYKAHAFLGSGSVVAQASAIAGAKFPSPSPGRTAGYLVAAASATLLAYFVATATFGFDGATKPGGLVLSFILCLALTTWGWQLFAAGQRRTMLVGIVGLVVLCSTYAASYALVHHMMVPAPIMAELSPATQLLPLAVALAFFVLLAIHVLITRPRCPKWLEPMRVHAMNGFYVDAVYRRVFATLG